jgi:cytochrome P450 family 6
MIDVISSLIIGLLSSVYTLYAAVFLSIAYYFSTSTHDKWSKLNVPHTKPLPLFGNSMKLVLNKEHPLDFFTGVYNRFPDEKLCGFYQMATPFLMIRDPELINNILIKDFSYFADRGYHKDPALNLIANGLFFM